MPPETEPGLILAEPVSDKAPLSSSKQSPNASSLSERVPVL